MFMIGGSGGDATEISCVDGGSYLATVALYNPSFWNLMDSGFAGGVLEHSNNADSETAPC